MRFDIELPWSEFKTQILDDNTWQWIYFDVDNHYRIFAKQNDFTVICKMYKDSGSDQTDFETNYIPLVSTRFESNVQTQFERTDIVLKIAKSKATFVAGAAEISIKVPGEIGSGDGRYVAGGFAFVNLFSFGDKVTHIKVVDVDNILGYGAETVIQTYHDVDVGTEENGWYLWPSHQGSGEIEIDPLGYYGFIPSGLYLEIYFESSLATDVYCDIWWGKS